MAFENQYQIQTSISPMETIFSVINEPSRKLNILDRADGRVS